MKDTLHTGLCATLTEEVTKARTAAALASGGLDIYATPLMITLMERASATAVAGALPEGSSTVGTQVNVAHVAPSPVGAKVFAEGVLTEIDGRRLVFDVRAWDEIGTIGKGTHERFIVDNEKFMAKAHNKKKEGAG